MQIKLFGMANANFDIGQSMTYHISYIHQILEKWNYNGTVHQLFIDFKKACDSFRREVLYTILIEFGIPMKLVALIKMCLNETCSRVRIGKNLSDKFTVRNGLKQGDALSSLLLNCFGICCQEGPGEPGRTDTEWDI
jgi:hypothetical protein